MILYNSGITSNLTGRSGAQQVVLILGAHHHGGDDHIVHHLVHQVLDVQLGRAGLDGLLVEALQFVALPPLRALESILSKYPKGTFKTITVDNGAEFQNCYAMEHDKNDAN